MATLAEKRDEILRRPVLWRDKRGVMHAATGDYLTPHDFCLWTKCGKHDVPANAGFRPAPDDVVDCPDCIATQA